MRMLWVLPYLPWPATSGGKTRQWQLLRALAGRGHRITLLAQSKEMPSAADRAALAPYLEELIVLPRRPLRHPLTLALALAGPWPVLTALNGAAPALTRRFKELLAQPWDVIQIEHSYTFEPCESALRGHEFILTEHNLESGLGGATYDRFPGWAWPFVRFDQWRARRWERRVFAAAAQIVAVTEADAQAMRTITRTPVNVVVNGVDCAAFSAARPAPDSLRILFLGNYEYPPNVDAVTWTIEHIMPGIWAAQPQARLAVAGHAMPADWPARWRDPRIEWLGFVADLPALQRRSAVFLAPLRQGGGSKLKVLEAMAAGLPLASTAQGVSGLAVVPGREYLGGDSAAELAQAVIALLQAPARALAIGEAARTYVRTHHDWSIAADQLEEVYARLPHAAPPGHDRAPAPLPQHQGAKHARGH
ncbi:glycosyltransferase [Corticibacter populi]|uniref:Glycosyltransferase n=1 Tax=Corticibacter populi TaxID=1550736 RepID=A0A3M6QLC1_9BURK|nr:glycosyltransferase family 4 protein [Corticibacter populi]RMX03531.1 glycosyltransferase [Corticibacter populi]RZS29981.1 glycosyltransferase involved in cell wall biosynthesis [Corticibacter populi]